MDITTLRRTFAGRIRKLREYKLNQGEFADSVGVSRGAMSYYEQASRTPDIGVLRAICDKYNVSADYLLGITDLPNPGAPAQTAAEACDNTALSSEAVKKLNLIARLANTDVNSYKNLKDNFTEDFPYVLTLAPFTSIPELLNLLIESEDGLGLLVLLGAIILDAEIDYDGNTQPALKFKSALKSFEISYPLENLNAALWVNIQSYADKIKQQLQAAAYSPNKNIPADKI